MINAACSIKRVIHVQLQDKPPGEGSAVLMIMNMCSYNTPPMGKGAQT